MSETPTFTPTRAMIGRWSVDRYVSTIRNWVIGAAVVIVVLVLDQKAQVVVVALEALFFLFIGALMRSRGGGRVEVLTAGAMSGLALGLVASVGRLIVYLSLYWVFNLIVETLLTGFLAALIAIIGSTLASFLPKTFIKH
ncbi:MAG: hypothetical protein HY975_02315 [Candidatus Kerfeldbacteria bacterium]|nr:hypothetical protein [Candidatus Kerfeldbacteria bacterium]